MVALPPLRPPAGVIGAQLGADSIASLETGLADAEARVANINSQGRIKHIKGRCGPEPLMYPRPCDAAQMRKFLIQEDLYSTGRQKLLNALAMTPQPRDRAKWYSLSARWANVMAFADNLAWTYLDGRMKNGIFESPDADSMAEEIRSSVVDAHRNEWGHKGERKVHIDLVQGLPIAGAVGGVIGGVSGSVDPWTAPDDYVAWTPWFDYDTIDPYKSCGGIFGGACPGYPSGKRYHRTIITNGAQRVAWWKKKLEVYAKHPLADLLAVAWGGYSEYLDLNVDKLGLTPAQMRAISEAKARADVQAATGKFELIKYIPVFGQIMWGILAGLAEVLPLAQGCQFSFYEFGERVIDDPECGAWGEGRTAASTVPKMYSALLTQGFDPQARLDEMNAPPREEPKSWVLPAAGIVGGAVVGAIIGKVVS